MTAKTKKAPAATEARKQKDRSLTPPTGYPTEQRPVKPESLLIDAPTAAAMLSIGKTKWYELHAAGRIPAPIRLGRAVRWHRAELERWTAAGCPARHVWEGMK